MKKRESKSPSRSTKRALTSSVLALVLCFVMLLGTTFAWFTDTASTKVNSIQAGTLDVELLDEGGNSLEGETLSWQKAKNHENEEVLWEPGATYNLQNVVIKNNGNLALKYKVVITAVNGTLADEETAANLADVLDVYMGETKVGTLTEALTSTDNDGYAWGHLSADSATGPITISLQMQTTAGNEYQNLYIDDIAVTVYATQWTEEYDSIDNQYDKNASYADSWDGNVGTVPTADANGKITITTAADFAAFAEDVNKGNGYQGKTVVLANDIDLNGYAWTPIGQTGNSPSGGDTGFYGTFDGQGHTIYGLNVDTSDLGEGNGNVTAGLFGWIDAAGATIKNVNISGATVKGNHYTGALVGYLSGTVENCSVTNSTVVSVHHDDDNDGDKAGGLVGYMNKNATVTNSSVSNSTVTAKRDAGGLVGCTYDNSCTVTGNSVSNTTVTTKQDYVAEIVGRPNKGFALDTDSNTATNVTAGKEVSDGVSQQGNTYYISSAEGLDWFNDQVNNQGNSFGGKTIQLTCDINYNGGDWLPVGQNYTLDYANLGYANPTEFGGIFDGNGHTISNIKIGKLTAEQVKQLNDNTDESGTTTDHAIHSVGFIGYSAGGTVKNLTISNATVTGYHNVGTILGYGDVGTVIDNCKVENSFVTGSHLTDDQCGDKVGGLVGFYNNGSKSISNCSVKNTTVTAARDAAQVVGYATGTTGLSNLSEESVTVTASSTGCTHERAGVVSTSALVGNGTANGLSLN